MTDQLKNRLNRLKKASAAASSASSAPTAPAASATRHGEEQPSADAEQPEETRTAEAAPEPLSEDGPKEKENQPPVSPDHATCCYRSLSKSEANFPPLLLLFTCILKKF